ncbi:hypothetical protein [Leifsonia sp. Leaf264]|uniref:hypothetical protein n=1 Tax=Leifsonia sp. Leaf264 TaxID=1736314 RepID=UPI0006FFB127|nr:hypothetical protein [Leifsonia sp. Leaf264]KQO98578.1 hypothetical protein ASF30_10985 [Leifsonia sp. Leaf264]
MSASIFSPRPFLSGRCRDREPVSFGCGTARLNARIQFYECDLDVDHDGDHYDKREKRSWERWPETAATPTLEDTNHA